MDPLSQIIGLLKPQAVFWRVVEAHDAWTIGFRPTNVVVFGQIIEGACHVEREDGIGFDLEAGDFMLMAAPPNWTMAAFGGGVTVDFKAVVEDPGVLLLARARDSSHTVHGRKLRFLSRQSRSDLDLDAAHCPCAR